MEVVMKKSFTGEIYFTPKQAAEHFNFSLSTIKNYIYAGKLRTLKTPGGHHRIRKSELLLTLGEDALSRKRLTDRPQQVVLSDAILAVFKIFGPVGESLIIHAKNVAELSIRISKAMGMSEFHLKRIQAAALVHDIGHIGLDKNIFSKKDALTLEEYDSIRKHPLIGKEILNSIKDLEDISDIVIQHHERVDGKGYPGGLYGHEIQKESCVISIAEAYDSMTSPSSYRAQISKRQAIEELSEKKGSQFDKDIVELFVKNI